MARKEASLIKTAEAVAEEQAKLKLQSFLNKNYWAIRAMRSYAQIRDSEMCLVFDQLKQLEEFIEKESGEQLSFFDGLLCMINDRTQQFQTHDGMLFGAELKENIKAIKGFYFSFILDGSHFEVVDLDFGRSREYFDQKDTLAKGAFIRRFAERKRSTLIFLGNLNTLPLGFTTFVADDGEKFKIEELVSYKDTVPLHYSLPRVKALS